MRRRRLVWLTLWAILSGTAPAVAQGPAAPDSAAAAPEEAAAATVTAPAPPAEAAVPAPPVASRTPPAATPPPGSRRRQRALRIVGLVGVSAAAALLAGAAVAFGFRLSYGSQWNDDARCLVNGRYRIDNCGDLNNKAVSAESLTWELAAGAGALGLTSLVLLLGSQPDRAPPHRPAVRLLPGPGRVGLACGGTF
jgi:hypothetical protein